jgi:hypothetical protein
MANSFSLTFTPAQYQELIPKAQEIGISPSRISGPLPEQDGVIMSYTVVPQADGGTIITFTVSHKPFYVSMDEIESHVKALISG